MSSEILILIEAVFIIALFLFFIVDKNFTHGIYLCLLTFLIFKYQKIAIMDSILPDISLDRIIFIFLIVMLMVQVLIGKRKILPLTKIEYSMFLFCLFAIISMVLTGKIVKEENKLCIGELLTGYIFPFSMFFISQNIYDTLEKRQGFIKFIILIGIYLSVTAMFEHFKIKNLIFPKYILNENFGIHFGRARGPFTQAAVNGTVLGIVFSSAFYFLFNSYKKKLWQACSIVLLTITPLAIFFTYTRACWVGAILGFIIIVVFTFKQNPKMFVVILSAFFIIAFLTAPFFLNDNTIVFASERIYQEGPIYARLNLYTVYINMFKDRPIFGVGFSMFQDKAYNYLENESGIIPFQYPTLLVEHDTFSCVLAEMGLVGITLILIIYISILLASIRLYKSFDLHNLEVKNMVIVFWGCMIVYAVNSVLIQMKYFEFVNSIFFIFAGIVCRQEREYRARDSL